MERHVPSAATAGDDGPAPPALPAVRPARRRGLTHQVTEQLIELIADSPSPAVSLPPERRLGEQLGVSRNVLREALAALDQMGLVETRGKTRIGLATRARVHRLARLSPDWATRELMLDPVEVRRIIEPETAALAAMRATDAALEDIEGWVELMEAGAAQGRSVVDEDAGFHVAIARATGNRMLIDLVSTLGDALRQSRELSFRPPEATRAAIGDHRAILDAARAGDAEGARRAMGAHLNHVEDLLRASIPDPDEQVP
jgi:GntR family transcriptional repressor for pyruvate dehydrogenase complex